MSSTVKIENSENTPTPTDDGTEGAATQTVRPPVEREKPQGVDTFVESVQWGILNQPRLSGNRRAIIAIPNELTQEDIDRIKSLLKGVEL